MDEEAMGQGWPPGGGVCADSGSAHAALPVLAVILVGGRSSRMGRPKALLDLNGRSILEHVAETAGKAVESVVLAGSADVPQRLGALERLPDAPGVSGPMAGVLAAMRWRPQARWVALACDLACIRKEALAWLLQQWRPGTDAVLPRLEDGGPVEPLFALYEPSARAALERSARRKEWSLQRALGREQVLSPLIPHGLRDAWINVNTPEEWRALTQRLQRNSGACKGEGAIPSS